MKTFGTALIEIAAYKKISLQGADLRWADLRWANLQGADLRWANLQEANLPWANLRGTNLQGTNLQGANLQGANLQGAKNIPLYVEEITKICPIEGEFIGWKKCRDGKIVKLLILSDSLRSNATNRKCRASKVKVLEIIDIYNKEHNEEAFGLYNSSFIYRLDEIIEIKDFDQDRWNECSTGIHFFITRYEAEQWNL